MSSPDTSLTIKSARFWMVALGGGIMAANSVRAFNNPEAFFATYLGLPVGAPGDAGLIDVYAQRALFIAMLVTAFVLWPRSKKAETV